jgi:hypothetical protein
MRVVRVANGQGFWGDSVDAPIELLEGGPIDYLGMDYLAEVTLSIMMRQKLRDPQAGYATDFLGFVRRALPALVEKNVRVITNESEGLPGEGVRDRARAGRLRAEDRRRRRRRPSRAPARADRERS